MSRLVKTFKHQFAKMKARNWDTVYVFVDMHETVLMPTWSVEMSINPYRLSIETLQLMSSHPNIKLILWSSSLPETNLSYKEWFETKGIYFDAINSNPNEPSTPYADFDTKPYMSVILDDKAGFQESDWETLYDYFVMLFSLSLLKELNNEGTSTTVKAKVATFLDNLSMNIDHGN